ncbi:hypothetical protein QJS10_CPB11g01200 [Acorus calamus]|uniref:Uncharacterized protein n=1 Tax=Acorus calamus TaxID=4465 RepID=A0AAV9DTD5_ACOCL|nr:hypothetical protein QJS10_CPB11g01200 [Acorus calamus]
MLSAVDERFTSSVGMYTLVAALIATATFATIFIMPGGSLVVVFCFIWAWKDPVMFKLSQLMWGHRPTVVACLGHARVTDDGGFRGGGGGAMPLVGGRGDPHVLGGACGGVRDT